MAMWNIELGLHHLTPSQTIKSCPRLVVASRNVEESIVMTVVVVLVGGGIKLRDSPCCLGIIDFKAWISSPVDGHGDHATDDAPEARDHVAEEHRRSEQGCPRSS